MVIRMSYIPKYIMKRMFPEDAFKAVAGGLEVTMVNVISPLSVDEVPDDVENYLEATVNGVKISDADKKKIKIITSQKTFMLSNAKEFAGVVLPVGEKLKVFLPGKFAKGDEPEVSITIKTEHPFELGGIKRKVC